MAVKLKGLYVKRHNNDKLYIEVNMFKFTFVIIDKYCLEVRNNFKQELYKEDIFDADDLNDYITIQRRKIHEILNKNPGIDNLYPIIEVDIPEGCDDWEMIEATFRDNV